MTASKKRAGHALLWAVSLLVGLAGACSSDPPKGNGRGGLGVSGYGGAGGTGTGGTGGTGSGIAGADNPDPNNGLPVPMGGAGGDEMCAGTMITASRILPTVMLVVDGSTSMLDPYGMTEAVDGGMPPPPPSRWASVRQALIGPDGVVPKLEGLVRFGLAVFGTQATCPLPLGKIDPALNNAAEITAGLPNDPPGLFTPTGVALDQIVDILPDPTLVLDGNPIGPQIILLATDGDPNACDGGGFFPVTDYAPSINAALKGQAKHLKMYVVSVGQDAAAAHLQEMANIGANEDRATGTAPVYYPEDAASLTATLETLIGAELSCDLSLMGKGVKEGLECTGKVFFNGAELECNGPDGFELKDSFTISLKGSTCETFKNSVDSSVRADFPCEAIIVE